MKFAENEFLGNEFPNYIVHALWISTIIYTVKKGGANKL